MSGFWESCLQRFEQELPAQQFNTWIRPLRLEGESSAAESGLRLIAPNSFILKWVRDRYLSRIEDYSRSFFANPVTISLVIGAAKAPAAPRAEVASDETVVEPRSAPAAAAPARKISAPEKSRGRPSNYETPRLFTSFTFDNLVVGKANDLARAAAVQVANNPGGAYNPLFIYGGTGRGKTHLIQAIGNQIKVLHPNKKVYYLTSERFGSEFFVAIQENKVQPFKDKYRKYD